MSIRQGRPEDYSKGPYLIVLDVAPCPLTSLLCLSNPRESLPLPYPSTCRSSFAPLLSFLVIAGRVCSRFETSRRELIPSCAFPIQSFLLLFFFFVLQQYLPSSFSSLLLPYYHILRDERLRESRRSCPPPLVGRNSTLPREIFETEEPFLSLLRFECSPRGGCVSKRILDARLSLSLPLPLSSRQLCNAFYLFTKANTHLPWRHG